MRAFIINQIDEMLKCVKFARTDIEDGKIAEYVVIRNNLRANHALSKIESILNVLRSLLVLKKKES